MVKNIQIKAVLLLGLALLTSCGKKEAELAMPESNEVQAGPINYHALVIGVSDYAGTGWPELGTARGDAEAIGNVLRTDFGFQVTALLDKEATRGNILRALDRCMQLSENDALLIYFAGHGFYDKPMDEGYWIPHGAEKERMDQPAKEDWLWNSSISRVVSASPARHVLLIADTCYGGSLFRGEEESDKSIYWYKRAARTPSRYLITSGNLEPVLDSGIRHSVFAQEILNYLHYSDHEVFSASDIAVSIRENVSKLTGQLVRMGPLATASHAGGEFVFLRETDLLDGAEAPLAQLEPIDPTTMRGSLSQLKKHLNTATENVKNAFVRPRILACIGPEGTDPEEAALVRARLHQQLNELGGCILVERADFDALLHEIELGQSSRADQRAASEIGKILPASLILFGEILPVGGSREIHLRITDTETSRLLSSTSASYSTSDEMEAACKELAQNVMKTMNTARPLLLPAEQLENGLLQAGWGQFHGARIGEPFQIISIEREGTISQEDVLLGRATLKSMGEETALFEVEWNQDADTTMPLWLKSAL